MASDEQARAIVRAGGKLEYDLTPAEARIIAGWLTAAAIEAEKGTEHAE